MCYPGKHGRQVHQCSHKKHGKLEEKVKCPGKYYVFLDMNSKFLYFPSAVKQPQGHSIRDPENGKHSGSLTLKWYFFWLSFRQGCFYRGNAVNNEGGHKSNVTMSHWLVTVVVFIIITRFHVSDVIDMLWPQTDRPSYKPDERNTWHPPEIFTEHVPESDLKEEGHIVPSNHKKKTSWTC